MTSHEHSVTAEQVRETANACALRGDTQAAWVLRQLWQQHDGLPEENAKLRAENANLLEAFEDAQADCNNQHDEIARLNAQVVEMAYAQAVLTEVELYRNTPNRHIADGILRRAKARAATYTAALSGVQGNE